MTCLSAVRKVWISELKTVWVPVLVIYRWQLLQYIYSVSDKSCSFILIGRHLRGGLDSLFTDNA